MKRRITIIMIVALVAVISLVLTVTSTAYADGATQISGIGNFDIPPVCPAINGYLFASVLTGDLDGCFYVNIETAKCSSGWIYRERGTNLFVGFYDGSYGTFEATYQYIGKYEECKVPEGFEYFGRCHHPIIVGSGTGVFDGVTGRLDFQDNIIDGVTQNFPYRGHLRW